MLDVLGEDERGNVSYTVRLCCDRMVLIHFYDHSHPGLQGIVRKQSGPNL